MQDNIFHCFLQIQEIQMRTACWNISYHPNTVSSLNMMLKLQYQDSYSWYSIRKQIPDPSNTPYDRKRKAHNDDTVFITTTRNEKSTVA